MATLTDGHGERKLMDVHLPLWAIRENKCPCQRVCHMDCRRACRQNIPTPARSSSQRCRSLNRLPTKNHTSHKLQVISRTRAKGGLTRIRCLRRVTLALRFPHQTAPTATISLREYTTKLFTTTWCYSSPTCSRSCQSFHKTSILIPSSLLILRP